MFKLFDFYELKGTFSQCGKSAQKLGDPSEGASESTGPGGGERTEGRQTLHTEAWATHWRAWGRARDGAAPPPGHTQGGEEERPTPEGPRLSGRGGEEESNASAGPRRETAKQNQSLQAAVGGDRGDSRAQSRQIPQGAARVGGRCRTRWTGRESSVQAESQE